MCRLRIPNGILKAAQFAGVADLAERYGGGYAHVTTRANLQIREIEPKNAVAMIEAIQDLGLCSRGSGADNIRNVTGTPTAGIDPQELIDTRPLCARMALPHSQRPLALRPAAQVQRRLRRRRHRSRCWKTPTTSASRPCEVKDGFGLEPGVWFRLCLGGITGHKDFARDTGVLVKPADATQGRRRGGARVHRSRRPHRPHQGAAEIRARRHGRREIPRPAGRKARPQARPRRAGRDGAAAAVRPHRPYRRSCAEAGRAQLDRRRRSRSAS